MPEPAAGGDDGSLASAAFAELHELLVGPDVDRIAHIEDRLNDAGKRAIDVAQVLPEAIRGSKGKALREALEPVFEKAFESSVRKHPKDLADAIFPVIGPAIRKSIAASIAEFAETLNQIVEKSVSLRAIQWRVEALVTGRPFSELLLTRSLLYSVEQVFLIHRKSGLLLMHVASQGSVLKDADMISGMLTAIQDFFSDSFTDGGQDLETVDAGRFKLWIQYGSKALVVGAVSGTAPTELKSVFRGAIEKVHQTLYAELDSFKQGDTSVFEPARPTLEACLLGQSGPGKKKSSWPVWVLLGLIGLLVAGGLWYRARERGRWDDYFDSLKHQPGLAITGVQKRDGVWIVDGLKDPLVKSPVHDKVQFRWQPFLSLDPAFAQQREFENIKTQLEGQLIRFDAGSSKLPLGEVRRIDEATLFIGKLLQLQPETRVTITGRADDVGSEETNNKLSLERAGRVLEALVSQGLPQNRLVASGLGKAQPLRKGASDWDRAANRSVIFQLTEP
jgi:outer membrane protein OmpA-like peptidoglycan-associated protein